MSPSSVPIAVARPMVTGPGAGAFEIAPALLAGYLLLALLAPALCRRWGRPALMSCGLLPAATTVWAAAQLPAVLDGGQRLVHVDLIPTLSIGIDLRLDALSLVMTLVVAGVGTLVFLYSGRYFPAGDDGLGKYAGSLLGFAGSMLGLVLADNLLLLVIFWELTGVLSYLLIAHRSGKRSSRVAATQAFLVTTAGGLVMLVGAVMLGVNAGTYLLSAILADPPSGPLITTSVVLLIVGGITKSAIVPFSFWLPGAMAAPTPASAYLHAATMVKAGIYLFARLAPAFADLSLWQPVLMVLGGSTLLYGGVVALRQRDLKLLLAYGTVSQLGLMTLLIGTGSPDALLGGLAMLIAHATFKAALFFVVGVIDTSTGTRDLTRLSGLRRSMPVMFWVSVLAAVSMAGVPPMIGFAAKEAGYAGILEGGSWGIAGTVVMTVGSALTVAYSIRFLWAAFSDKPGRPDTTVGPSSAWMAGPAVGLAALGLVLGLVPQLLEPLVQSYARTAGQTHEDAMALWHGFTLPLALSAAGWVVGALIFLGQRRRERARGVAAPGAEPGRSYRATTAGVDAVAVAVTHATQRGSLPVSLGAILVVLIAFPGTMLIKAGVGPGPVETFGDPAEVLISVVILALAVVLLRVQGGMVAIVLVGGVGYAVAVLFILRGAPDIALTQLLVETITLVAGLLVLTRMPDRALFTNRRGNGFRAVVALCAGALMTALALIIPGTRTVAPISEALPDPTVSYGGGSNIVNVILVDVRGWDTFGEISVLIAAATGVASLVFLSQRTGSVPRRPTALAEAAKPERPSPWLATDWTPRRSLLLEVVTRLIFHIIVVFSLYVLFVGHDEPGGGFAAGLIVGLALTLRYLAGGAFELGEAAPVDAGIVMGIGLLIAAVMAVVGLLAGGSALQSTIFEGDVTGLGHLKFVTSTIFDIGVYLVVIGLVLDVLRSLGAELDRQAVTDRLGDDRARPPRRTHRPAAGGRGRGR